MNASDIGVIESTIQFNLPEPLVDKPYKINNFFSDEMFERVRKKIDSLGMGPSGALKYHTMIGRWESPVEFDSDIEDFCLEQARTIFRDKTLKKAYFFVCRYQIHEGCIPSLWEHTDQNGTQTTIDVAIENTADWDLLVEREIFSQEPNSAMIFAGQQHMHARPDYPTDDASVYTTVLFLHFTQPEHWIQKNQRGIYEYGSDGDIRYFNRNRFLALPDIPVGQPVCECHDYSTGMNLYNTMFGNMVDGQIEITAMDMQSKKVIAPGIVEYSFSKDSARILKGLLQNHCFRMWEPAEVLGPDRKPTTNYNARRCYVRFMNANSLSCHPFDPATRLYASLENGIWPIVDDFRKMYFLNELVSDSWSLLRYEKNNNFHNHFDDCYEYPRVVSATIFLNDDFEGGELVFPNHDVTIKPEAGKIVLFSSAFPFIHRVNPVLRGTRYAAVKWFRHASAGKVDV